jgi:HAD superfamily hydrolase (TIGR01450 family)
MRGVILAAGIGSRLRPISIERHKSCVTVGGDPIIVHQLRAFRASGVDDVHVVTGYLSDQVSARCSAFAEGDDELDVTVHRSDVYANTNNMYSLYLLRDVVDGEAFVLGNGDVVFEPAVLSELLAAPSDSAIACDPSTYSAEGMKVTVDDRGRVDHLAKDVPETDAYATSIDLYRFSSSFSRRLFDDIEHRIEVDGAYGCWTEVAIDDVVGTANHDLEPADVSGADWVEVDDREDLLAADRRFSPIEDLRSKEAVFFDLDGTLYLDDQLVDGARDVVETLRANDTDVYFLSNNSSRWKPDYASKLSALGIPATEDQVVLSTQGVISYLDERGSDDVYVVGSSSMREAFRDAGFAATAADPAAVVVGFDTDLTYEKVRRATLHIRDGAEFLLAHADLVCPTAEGLVPDCGSIGALIEAATGREPTRVFGKPHPEMITPVLEERGLVPEQIAIVGDRLDTDIRLAENVGCDSVCVLTGDADRLDIETHDLSPSLVVDSVDSFEYAEITPDDEARASGTIQESG